MSKKIVAENIKLKRAYDSAGSGDGTRILIDRLWPRGVRKADAAIDLWAKDIAPSTALRRWFGHDPARCTSFDAFTRMRYIGIATASANYAPSLKEDGLPLSLQRMMRLITTPSF